MEKFRKLQMKREGAMDFGELPSGLISMSSVESSLRSKTSSRAKADAKRISSSPCVLYLTAYG
jgi:hypothetical protein